MNEYMLIFRHEDGAKIASPEQMQEWMQQTMDWIAGISAKGEFVRGCGLPFQDAKVVHSDKRVTNGPFGGIKETIGGYIVVKCSDADAATEHAKGCPVLQGPGNSVEVRLIASGDGVH